MWDRERVFGEPLCQHRGQLPGARLYACLLQRARDRSARAYTPDPRLM